MPSAAMIPAMSPPESLKERRLKGKLRRALLAHDDARQIAAEREAVVIALVRKLAKQRGVAFIRIETARRELGL